METDITYADGSPGVGYVHNWNSFDCKLIDMYTIGTVLIAG